jgi:hypothetical protein
MSKAYRVLKDSEIEPKAKNGAIIYDCHYCDYGLASDDTRMTGIEHESFTFDPEGGYPFFTMPVRDVEPL